MTEDEDSDSVHPSGDSWHHDSRLGSPDSAAAEDGDHVDDTRDATAAADSLPAQKRRRVTRACDECRRKKIKCDGKSPCTHCTVYSYECTYDKPSNRRRNPAPQYIEALENRLNLAEALLRKFIPNVDLSDPNLEPSVQQEFRKRALARAKSMATDDVDARVAAITSSLANGGRNGSILASNDTGGGSDDDNDMGLILESIGQLQLDDGGWDFHGSSSGAVFLTRMFAHFDGRLGKVPFLPLPKTRPSVPSTAESSPNGPGASPQDTHTLANGSELPSKDEARSLCAYALTYGACFVQILHRPSFYTQLEQMYEKPITQYTDDDMRFLGLLYAVMALGCVYRGLESTDASSTWQSAKEEGTRWYNLSGTILPNLNDSRDIASLQTLMFRILFLQSTSSLSTCYTLIGVAVRCALRMGLHRHLKHDSISPIALEVRRRVFWSIRQLDIYVSVMLGFPVLLNADEIDQVYPTEVDDEYITQEGIISSAPPPGSPSYMQPFNAMTNLMEILHKIARWVYPMHGVKSGFKPDGTETYRVGYAKLKEIEADLAKWYSDLPSAWRPNADGPVETVRARHQLRFTYAHVQLVLYRPFLQYVSPRLSQQKKIDALSYACAAACINVSRNIIHIGSEIRKQSVLSGPFWFMLYTEFFAALSLVFYVIENAEKPGSIDLLADATCARQNVSKLAHKSLAAETITGALNRLFDQLPHGVEMGKAAPVASRKRAAPAPSLPMNPHQVHSLQHRHSMDARSQSGTPPAKGVSRRSTEGSHSVPDQSKVAPHPPPPEQPHPFAMMQEFLPSDHLTSARATPESTIDTPGNSNSRLADVYQSPAAAGQQQHQMAGNPLQKLNSLMFPTNDPFAYPMQPMMELGFVQNPQQKGQQDLMGMQPMYMPMGFDGNFFSDMQSQQQQQQQQQPQQAGQQTINLREMFGPAMMVMPQDGGAYVQPKMDPEQNGMLGMGDEWSELWDFQGM